MAKIPNAEKAIIETKKLKNYILSPSHPLGRFKAAYFLKLGYSVSNWELLKQHLRDLALANDVIVTQDIRYGKKYVIEGFLPCPVGEKVKVITVWVILKSENIPRFVTVYPGG